MTYRQILSENLIPGNGHGLPSGKPAKTIYLSPDEINYPIVRPVKELTLRHGNRNYDLHPQLRVIIHSSSQWTSTILLIDHRSWITRACP